MKNKYCPNSPHVFIGEYVCPCCDALNRQREDMEKEIKGVEEYVDEKVKITHKTCLTDQFDNGRFWAYKDIQMLLQALKDQEPLKVDKEV